MKGVPGPKPPKFLFVAKESKKFRSNWACARGAVRPSNAAAAAGERREGMIRELLLSTTCKVSIEVWLYRRAAALQL